MPETHRIREPQHGAEGRRNANETETVDSQRIERVEDETRQAGTTEEILRNPNGEATAKNRSSENVVGIIKPLKWDLEGIYVDHHTDEVWRVRWSCTRSTPLFSFPPSFSEIKINK